MNFGTEKGMEKQKTGIREFMINILILNIMIINQYWLSMRL